MRMRWLMRAVCLILVALLCASCSGKRQEGKGGQEQSSSQGLIQASAGGEGSSSSVVAASSQTESVPETDDPSSSVGTASGTESPAPVESSASARSIADFDIGAARIQPTCYLPERDSFLSRSYHDCSALCLVGFSPDGKLAFLKETELDGKGGTDLSFVIQDLVSDEILWELKTPSDDEYALGENLYGRFIADYGSQIDKKLSGYGIVISPCEYKSMPYSGGGLSISARIESRATGKLMYEMFEITSYSCIVTDGRGRSKKVIADREFMGPEAFVCGCVKSPFEDRLALVVAEATYGFEGCDLLVRIAGCDLKKGF